MAVAGFTCQVQFTDEPVILKREVPLSQDVSEDGVVTKASPCTVIGGFLSGTEW